jgi:hypothetical protein
MEAVITDRKPEAPWRLYSLTENQRPHGTCNHSLKTIGPMEAVITHRKPEAPWNL